MAGAGCGASRGALGGIFAKYASEIGLALLQTVLDMLSSSSPSRSPNAS